MFLPFACLLRLFLEQLRLPCLGTHVDFEGLGALDDSAHLSSAPFLLFPLLQFFLSDAVIPKCSMFRAQLLFDVACLAFLSPIYPRCPVRLLHPGLLISVHPLSLR